MESYQFIAGFSDIKKQFINKREIKKSMNELRIWFSFGSGELYVHDYNNDKVSMMIALNLKEEWKCYLIPESLGARTVLHYLLESEKKKLNPDIILNSAYNLSGFLF